jgi:hypothetical protein
MVHNHYLDGYRQLERKRPIFNIYGLLSGNWVTYYDGDPITLELQRSSPSANLLAELTYEEPKFVKMKLGTFERKF